MFVDYAIINVEAGTGGSGAEAFRREMGVPRGGPSGGNGGRGGDVILRGDRQLATLLDYQYQHMYRAERGEHGQGKSRFGKDAEDLVLRVPIGTVVKDADTDEIIGEIIDEGQELIAQGGLTVVNPSVMPSIPKEFRFTADPSSLTDVIAEVQPDNYQTWVRAWQEVKAGG